MRRTDAKLPVIPAKVALEKDDHFARISEPDGADGVANVGGTRQGDLGRTTTVHVGRYVLVNTCSTLGTVRDCPPPVWRFRDDAKR